MTDSFFSQIHLGRYELKERIGTGGMARVFSALDTNLDRTVAVKILHDHLADDETFKERFQREARFVASFSHPNIIQVYDFDVVEIGNQCVYYMVMPYIPGNTLKDVLENYQKSDQRMPQAEVLSIISKLGEALDYAHDRGMVHRDVKPANIMFTEQGEPLLSDFGIARLVASSNLTQDGVTTGTPTYMSPEQVTGLPVDARSDIYALGVILFEMLSGRAPYVEENNISTMLQHIKAPIPRLSDFLESENPALDNVIYSALAKAPDDRFNSTQEMVTAVQQAFITPQIGSIPGTIKIDNPVSVVQQTSTANTNSLSLAAITSQLQPTLILRRSPQGIFVVGLVVIGLLVTVALTGRVWMTPASSISEQNISAVPSMTGEEVFYFTADFAPNSELNAGWQIADDSTTSQEFTADGFYRFSNLQPGTAATSIFDPAYQYSNVSITLEAVLDADSGRSSGYGIVFNYLDDDHYNVFAVDGAGRYSIWVREAGNWQELRQADENWTNAEAVHPIGESNQLHIEINDGHFSGYVNDILVADVTDSTLTMGNVGIYLATPNSSTASLRVDSYAVEPVSQTTPSMTADEEG